MSLDKYLVAAKEAARKAGAVLRENIDETSKIIFKGDVDLVTNFDNQSQSIIFEHLSNNVLKLSQK